MKEGIEDSRDSEIINEELLAKNKEKNEKISYLKANEKVLID